MKFRFEKKSVSTGNNILCIADERGNLKYDLKISVLLNRKTIRIYDAARQEVAVSKQELMSLMPKYSVFVGGEKVLEIKKIFHPLLPKYELSGMGWEIKTGPMIHYYTITKDGVVVVDSTHDRIYDMDTCTFEVCDPAQELAAVAAVVAISFGIEYDHLQPEDCR